MNAAPDVEKRIRSVRRLGRQLYVPPGAHIYVLFQRGTCIYVGQSQNVTHRLSGHFGKGFDEVLVIPCEYEDANVLEFYLQRYLCVHVPKQVACTSFRPGSAIGAGAVYYEQQGALALIKKLRTPKRKRRTR